MAIDYEHLLENPKANAPKGVALAPLLKEAASRYPLTALTEAKKYIKLLPEDEGVALLKQAAISTRDAALYVVDDYIEFIPEAERAGLLKEIATDLLKASQGSPEVTSNSILNRYLDSNTLQDLTENSEKENLIATLNFQHDLKPEQRFAAIDNYDAQKLYELIAFGQQESMYTSTYLEVLNRLDKQLNKENKNIYDLKQSEHYDSAHAYLQKAMFHNRLDTALPYIPRDKWQGILENTDKFIQNGNKPSVVFLADILKHMPDESLKKQIEQFVQEKYASSSGRTKDIYGIIASYHNGDTKPPPIPLESPSIYAIPTLEEVSTRELLGSDGIHRQLVVFSNDPDGQYSYDTFLKQYTSSKDYTVVDKGDFIKIVPASRDDTRMEIYLNKPSALPENIMETLRRDKKSGEPHDLEFDMVVHRGHSYNLENTMPFFPLAMRSSLLVRADQIKT